MEAVVDAMITGRRLSELRARPCNLVINCGQKKTNVRKSVSLRVDGRLQ